MPRVKIGARHQVTLPAETLKRLGLDAGEELEVVEHEKMILLVPRKHIPKDQEWYYTDAWQRMMQEAFDEVKQGKLIGPFDTAEEAIRALKNTHV
jgi:AbrB family looped-hinge helix DNA binding protein